MSPLWNLLLALGVPAGCMILVLTVTALMPPEGASLAPERGTPLRRRTAARIRTLGSTMMVVCWGIAVVGRWLGLPDQDRWLEWFYALTGAGVWLVGWLDARDDRP